MSRLRGAIVGLGNIASRGHIPAFNCLKDRVEIIAAADLVEENRSRASELLPGASFYSDLHSLLENHKPDFVDICTPPKTHAGFIRSCASKGIHVLCEKPLAESFDSVLETAEMIRRSGIVFVPCHQYKYSPLWKAFHDIMGSGALGDVTLAQFNVFRLQADTGTSSWNPEWRTSRDQSGGGILVDTGAHYLYLSKHFFGVPQKISALLRTLKHSYGVEDTALVTLEYPKRLVEINLTWAASQRANSAYAAGTAGSLSYDGTRLILTEESGTREIPMPDVSDKSQYVGWYVSLFDDFFGRIGSKNFSVDPLDEAVTVMKMLDACYRSSDMHAVLAL